MKSLSFFIFAVLTLGNLFSQEVKKENIVLVADKRPETTMSSIILLSIYRARSSSSSVIAFEDELEVRKVEDDYINDLKSVILGLTSVDNGSLFYEEVAINELPENGIYFELAVFSYMQPGVRYDRGNFPIQAHLTVIREGKSRFLTIIPYNSTVNKLAYAVKNSLLDYSIIFEKSRPSVKSLYLNGRIRQKVTHGF